MGGMTTITHPVHHQQQTHRMSCWAASAAMITGRSESEILEQFADFGNDGADEPECRDLAGRLGLTVLPEACRASDGWWQLLERGPVMVGIPNHFIVVSGISYDESSGAWHLLVNDPANAGSEWRQLETVENGYEADWNFSYDLLQR
jgi:ABC-type bacteriocin/lantibiotic exporter with double-glycine peptidase domain